MSAADTAPIAAGSVLFAADRSPGINDDEALAAATLELLSYLQTLRDFAGLPAATLQANAMLAAALGLLYCEVGADGVGRILTTAMAQNARKGARDESMRRSS